MPEDAIDYRREYEKEQERLTKLWDAYEIQERDFEQAKEKIKVLDDIVAEKERIILSLRQVAENRDAEIRDLEIKVSSLERENSSFEPKFKEMEKDNDAFVVNLAHPHCRFCARCWSGYLWKRDNFSPTCDSALVSARLPGDGICPSIAD